MRTGWDSVATTDLETNLVNSVGRANPPNEIDELPSQPTYTFHFTTHLT